MWWIDTYFTDEEAKAKRSLAQRQDQKAVLIHNLIFSPVDWKCEERTFY